MWLARCFLLVAMLILGGCTQSAQQYSSQQGNAINPYPSQQQRATHPDTTGYPYPAETPIPVRQVGPTIPVDEPAPVLGVVIGRNREVLHIEPFSAAENAGMQLGDVIEQINDVSLEYNRVQAKWLINTSPKGTNLHVLLKRQDATIELEVMPSIIHIPEHNAPLPSVTPVFWPQDYL